MNEKFRLSDHYGSIHRTGHFYRISFDRLLNHPIKKVWDAITLPEQLALWLSSNHKEPSTEIDLKLGGKVRMQFMMAMSEGKITQLKSETLLEITWSGDNISRWELFEVGKKKCRLVFTETLPVSILPKAAAAYHGYLDFLSHPGR